MSVYWTTLTKIKDCIMTAGECKISLHYFAMTMKKHDSNLCNITDQSTNNYCSDIVVTTPLFTLQIPYEILSLEFLNLDYDHMRKCYSLQLLTTDSIYRVDANFFWQSVYIFEDNTIVLSFKSLNNYLNFFSIKPDGVIRMYRDNYNHHSANSSTAALTWDADADFSFLLQCLADYVIHNHKGETI